MSTSIYTDYVSPNPLRVPVGVWTTIVVAAMPTTGTHVHAMLYVNVTGTLKDGHVSGAFDLRAVRKGTTDDTSLDTRVAASETEGGAFTTFCTLTWFGADPSGFTYQIRPRVGIATCQVNTRYGKGLSA